MALNNNDAAVCIDSPNEEAVTSCAGEIDLYDDLIVFAELSPEEQLRLVDRPEKVASDKPEDVSVPEPVLAHAPIEPVEPMPAAVETETPSSEEAEKHTSPEPALTHLTIQAVEVKTWAAELEKLSAEEEAEEQTPPEPVLTHPLIESVESDTIVRASESDSHSQNSNAYAETGKVSPPAFGTRPSGPLSGFNLPTDIVYTGALSRGVCLACGAESDADDLFCITCGVFIDEIASTLPVNPTCAECKQRIAADEIFCPWCGSVQSVA